MLVPSSFIVEKVLCFHSFSFKEKLEENTTQSLYGMKSLLYYHYLWPKEDSGMKYILSI